MTLVCTQNNYWSIQIPSHHSNIKPLINMVQLLGMYDSLSQLSEVPVTTKFILVEGKGFDFIDCIKQLRNLHVDV